MNLWLAALRNTTSLQNPNGLALIDLFPLAMSLLAMNLDLLGKAINIIDGYFLLDGVLILQVPPLAAVSLTYSLTYCQLDFCCRFVPRVQCCALERCCRHKLEGHVDLA
jgi:hypothetical protein